MAQILSGAGAAFLRHHEGFVDHYYLDPVGVGTLGTGFTWGSDSFREWWGKNKPGQPFARGATMTRAEADDCLVYLCAREYGASVGKFLGTVPQHVFDGAVSPVYNLGIGALKWKWAAAVKAGNYADAAARLRNTGVTAKGKKLSGLVSRRREEGELIEHGDYTLRNAVNDPLSDGVLVRGERGRPVADLQQSLAALGFYTGAVDGIFGYGTQAAVLDFQRAHRLVADGYAGPLTLNALARPATPPAPTTPANPLPPRTDDPAGKAAPSNARGWLGIIILALSAIGAAVTAGWGWITALIERIF